MSTTVRTPRQVVRAAAVHAPDQVLAAGWVAVEGDRIHAVGQGKPPEGEVLDDGYAVLAPGFVDMHCHGGGGVAFADGPEAALAARDAHLRHGTTTLMASLVTEEIPTLLRQVEELAALVRAGELGGIHLEGPWLSEDHCGAHPPALLRDPGVDEVTALADAAGEALVMVSLAPERAGGTEATELLHTRGVRVAVGHTGAGYEQTRAAIDAGASVATHLYNGMPSLHHRRPGPVLALLEDPQVWIESIVDDVHLHPAVVAETAARVGDRWVLVSDAMAAALARDGRYRLGQLDVDVADGVARLAGGGPIAGSTHSLDRAVRTAVAAGVPLERAIRAATAAPAAAMGWTDVGTLTPGRRADLVLLDEDLRVARVMRAGRWVDAVGG